MANKNFTALETEEQQALVKYLEIRKLKFTAIPNGTFTKSWAVKMKNKRDGLRAGLPDLLVILPHKLLFIEMKRLKGGKVSPEQQDWIEQLNKIGDQVEAIVSRGCGEAIDKIEQELKKLSTKN
jgi:hypothetical protein